MLLVWPLVTALLWQRLPPDRALVWTILGAYLVLPPAIAFNLPGVPDLGKDSIPPLMALAMVLLHRRERLPILPDSRIARGLMLVFVLSPFITVLTNGDALSRGPDQVQGMRLYDSLSVMANQAIAVLPYFLARRYMAEPGAVRVLLVALALGGLAYSLPMLVEIRLSPQLNVMVYGYFQHDFAQAIRSGGFRPFVFLPHGLWVALFAMMATMAALALAREGPTERRPMLLFATLWLFAVLVLCKSLGPLIYAALLTPLLLLAPLRIQMLVAAGLALVVLTYPLLRGAHLIPLDQILAFADGVSAERAQSFGFRVANEEALLAHAAERPWFGWGGYGRNLIFDAVTGHRLTIPDGGWIIVLGIYGWLGYIAQFGLLVLPLLLMGREALWRRAVLTQSVAALCLIYAANLVDLLPNATLVPLSWLMAGALLGQAERLARERHGAPTAATAAAVVARAGPRTVI